jgi:hypothetical protein
VGKRAAEALLAEALRLDGFDAARLAALADAVTDWESVVESAERANVSGFVWNAFAATGDPGRIPSSERERLRRTTVKSTVRASLALAATRGAARALHAGGVEALAMKGIALLLRYPEYRALRHVDDVDLVVRPADEERADALLVAAGFRRELARDVPELLVANSHHAIYRDPHGFPLELHDAPPEEDRAAADAIWERSEPAMAGLRIPCPEDMLGIAARHALEHHRTNPDDHIPRMIADVRLLLARGTDPERARKLHDREGSRPVEAALEFVHRGVAFSHAATKPAYVSVHLRRARRFGWSHLVPPRAFIARKYGVSPRSPRLPFLYVRRLLEGVARLLRPGR